MLGVMYYLCWVAILHSDGCLYGCGRQAPRCCDAALTCSSTGRHSVTCPRGRPTPGASVRRPRACAPLSTTEQLIPLVQLLSKFRPIVTWVRHLPWPYLCLSQHRLVGGHS
jgi:hypothetical protein